jgi:hypothetical protein
MFQRTMAQKGNDKVNKGQWGPMSRESFFWRMAKNVGEYKIYIDIYIYTPSTGSTEVNSAESLLSPYAKDFGFA